VKLQVPPLRYATVGMTKWRVAAHLGSGGAGWTESTNEGLRTHQPPTYDPDLGKYAICLIIGQLGETAGRQDELG
jgi:hypothetical protein